MAENSKIEWTTHTFNPWWGCTKVSQGCKNCYAETLSERYKKDIWGPGKQREGRAASYWKAPLKWNKDAEGATERPRVFCASMADVFEENTDLIEWQAALFELIRQTENLDWLLLTKRPHNIIKTLDLAECYEIGKPSIGAESNHALVQWLGDWRNGTPPQNVWMGTSVEDQDAANKRIPELLRIPAVVRFLSCEPLIGPVSFRWAKWQPFSSEPGGITNEYDGIKGIDWVICGGESGPGARPMHPDWARNLRDQCAEAWVPFLFKQWGAWFPVFSGGPDAPKGDIQKNHVFEDGQNMWLVGKHAAGRSLDGRTHDEYPEVSQ